ncbi:MAG: YcgL domain-containing protein [Halieaceae bacterium]|nr:YcgL domain-containing protein [Halieaceae bacterium]
MTEADDAAARDDVTLCEVFRSPRREGLYLYVKRSEGLRCVPGDLLDRFGKPESALVFRLHRGRSLARVSAADVLDALEARGYFLQLPPTPEQSAAGAAQAGDAAVDRAANADAERSERR